MDPLLFVPGFLGKIYTYRIFCNKRPLSNKSPLYNKHPLLKFPTKFIKKGPQFSMLSCGVFGIGLIRIIF